MNGQVLINKTDMDGDYTTVFFTVPSLNIDSKMKVANEDFIKQLGIGGYAQLGLFLLNQLDKGIQDIINDVIDQSKATTTEAENESTEATTVKKTPEGSNIIKGDK